MVGWLKSLLYAANSIVQGKQRYKRCLPAARWLSVISFLLSLTRSHPPTAPNIPKATQAYLKVIFIKTIPAAWGGCKRAGGPCLHLLLYNYDTTQPVTFGTGSCCRFVFRQRCVSGTGKIRDVGKICVYGILHDICMTMCHLQIRG